MALGPCHHNDDDLKTMEEHKLRAVSHLLQRAGKTLGELVAAVEEAADELKEAYLDLDEEWRGENMGKFLEMMIRDGCFLLEVMRVAAWGHSIPDYAHSDPILSWHGIQHIKLFIQRDMLMVENQVPLRLLERILTVESDTYPSAILINSTVLMFLERSDASEGRAELGLHPLDICRTSMLKGPKKHLHRGVEMKLVQDVSFHRLQDLPRSAWKLSGAAGVQFSHTNAHYIDDINFSNGRLKMPILQLDDSTAYTLHNMMAFEAMHVGTGNDVTAHVLFVKDIVDSVDDVRLLASKQILENDFADDDAVVRLFNDLTRDVSKSWESELCHVRDDMEHCYRSHNFRMFLYESWANVRSKYFSSPWIALATVFFLILGPFVADVVQATYAVMSYNRK